MSNLILVRHGQSKFNLERRFTGFYDVELTSQGEIEAKYAGELIKKLNIKSNDFRFCVELPIKMHLAKMKYQTLPSYEKKRIAGKKFSTRRTNL